MQELKTKLGRDIPITTRGIVYLCNFTGNKIDVVGELLYDSAFQALEAYANIPNPESQLVTGKDYNELISSLHILHKNMEDSKWLTELSECI